MTHGIVIRKPSVADGADLWQAVKQSKTLDVNSAYLYLLLCRDFAATCRVAERDSRLVGFVTGYRPPGSGDIAFLWQVGVDASCRGEGLGRRLVHAFIEAAAAEGARWLETTISPSNQASEALFRGVARDLGASCDVSPGFTARDFPPDTTHEAEPRYRIGPFDHSLLNRTQHEETA